MLGTAAPKSSSTVTMTACATSKAGPLSPSLAPAGGGGEGARRAGEEVLTAPIEVFANPGWEASPVEDRNEPSSLPPLARFPSSVGRESPGVRADLFSELALATEGAARFFAN